MLSSSFGHGEPQYQQHHEDHGLGLGTFATGVVGAAAVGGLGDLAYKHFAGQPGTRNRAASPGKVSPGKASPGKACRKARRPG